jgi:hypothetical protein
VYVLHYDSRMQPNCCTKWCTQVGTVHEIGMHMYSTAFLEPSYMAPCKKSLLLVECSICRSYQVKHCCRLLCGMVAFSRPQTNEYATQAVSSTIVYSSYGREGICWSAARCTCHQQSIDTKSH